MLKTSAIVAFGVIALPLLSPQFGMAAAAPEHLH